MIVLKKFCDAAVQFLDADNMEETGAIILKQYC